MPNTQTLIAQAYSAFNRRDIDSALALSGDLLSESEVWHIYTIANGLIERMDLIENGTGSDSTPNAAFSRQ